MSHDEALMRRAYDAYWVGSDDEWTHARGIRNVLDLLAAEGRLVEPHGFYITPDGDGDPAIWRDEPGGHPVGVGTRFMAGNARIEPALAEWLWSVIPSREVTE